MLIEQEAHSFVEPSEALYADPLRLCLIAHAGLRKPHFAAGVLKILYTHGGSSLTQGASCLKYTSESPIMSHLNLRIFLSSSTAKSELAMKQVFSLQAIHAEQLELMSGDVLGRWLGLATVHCCFVDCCFIRAIFTIVFHRWYTLFTLIMGAFATFLTALVAVVWQGHHHLGPGEIGIALFSVFQVH